MVIFGWGVVPPLRKFKRGIGHRAILLSGMEGELLALWIFMLPFLCGLNSCTH